MTEDSKRTLPIKFIVEQEAFPRPDIIFRSDRDGIPEIYGINADRTRLFRFTDDDVIQQ